MVFTMKAKPRPASQKVEGLSVDDIFPPRFLESLGKVILDAVLLELQKDRAKQGGNPTPRGTPAGIPTDPRFMKSFSFRVDGTTIEILSTWPTAKQILEGSGPFKMKWLTQAQGVKRVPVATTGLGEVIIRTTPKQTSDAWVHPGFRKHDFIQRGLKRANAQIEKMIGDQIKAKIEERRYL